MKILPISLKNNVFKADSETKDSVTGEYKDPLMRWPLRGAAFTNEIGEALRPMIGQYATLSWAPALLYIGADIYDKYKNDKTEYSPNSRRCLKQAIFQGMASIFLPLVAVKFGQNLFSMFGYLSKDKIKLNDKGHINKLAQEFVTNGNMKAYDGKDKECIEKFKDIVANNTEYNDNKTINRKIIKKPITFLEKVFMKDLFARKQKNIDNYSNEIIIELITLRKNLLSPTEAFKESSFYKTFNVLQQEGQTKSVAVKNVLINCLKRKDITGKIIKTAGGFLALGLAIKPIDRFVENVLIGKVIEPTLNNKKTR